MTLARDRTSDTEGWSLSRNISRKAGSADSDRACDTVVDGDVIANAKCDGISLKDSPIDSY